MSKIRTSNTVALILRRLNDAEHGDVDAIELIGLEDELSRVERKWREQIAAGSERRQPGDPAKLDEWFKRLRRLIEAALRQRRFDGPTGAALQSTLEKLAARRPIDQT